MLKFYVDAKIRLNQSTNNLVDLFENRDDAGFAAAENIALAVAGVLIVGLAFAFFRDNLDGWLGDLADNITNPGGP